MPDDRHAERYQTHVDAITAQLGTRATAASLILAQRIAGLTVLCETAENELKKKGRMSDPKTYLSAMKALRDACICIGVSLNPRTATSRQRADAAHDDHAALMLDDDA